MANQEHLAILKQGVEVWNKWRKQQLTVYPDLSEAYLREASLSRANLRYANLRNADLALADLRDADLLYASLRDAVLIYANLSGADLRIAHLNGADLQCANLSRANLFSANLSEANLSQAQLNGADLRIAYLEKADLTEANLSEANLSQANLNKGVLVGTNFTGATLTGCSIYGISAWKVQLERAAQDNLVITPSFSFEPIITVDNLEVAQFIYLLLNNAKIRDVIDTITSKVVLILGRFTPERKAVLDALRDELRKRNYSPVLFDFNKPASRDLTETVSILAHMARFVIADITDAKSIPQELMIIVPNLPSVPVQPLILESQHEYGMFEHFKRFPWVLPIYRYTDEVSLIQSLQAKVIVPAEQKAKELEKL